MRNTLPAVGQTATAIQGAAADSPQARETEALMALVSRALAFQSRTGLRLSKALDALVAEAEAEEAVDLRTAAEVARRRHLREEAEMAAVHARLSVEEAEAEAEEARAARAAARAARAAARVLSPEEEAVRLARAQAADKALAEALWGST